MNNKKDLLDTVSVFFTVYIRGLQGFVGKVDIDEMLNKEGGDLVIWFEGENLNLNNSYKKVDF
jgi:hypothetical protein